MKISLENSSRTHVLAEDGHCTKYSSQMSEDACSQLLRLWSRPPPAFAPAAASESSINNQVIIHASGISFNVFNKNLLQSLTQM